MSFQANLLNLLQPTNSARGREKYINGTFYSLNLMADYQNDCLGDFDVRFYWVTLSRIHSHSTQVKQKEGKKASKRSEKIQFKSSSFS